MLVSGSVLTNKNAVMKMSFLKKYSVICFITGLLFTAGGCKKGFLDTVPDNITTLENVFASRVMSEQWLARVYNAMPDMWLTPYTTQWGGMSDELDYTWLSLPMNNGALVPDGTAGYWQSYYQAIRYAGVFLQNIDKNQEILNLNNGAQLIQQYKGEARFLRAYYYFQLMKIYGPVVLMGEIPGDVSTDYQLPRNTWSECVNYVLSEMEKAKADVPDTHMVNGSADLTQVGRITKGIIMAAQSQVLLYDASPLFNGNTEMSDFKNFDGKQLISQTYDANKWKKAADAAKAVIDLNKWQLYKEANADPFRAAFLSVKNLYWNGWQTEGIFLRPANAVNDGGAGWSRHCAPRNSNGTAWNGMGVVQELVDAYRMINGKGINETGSGYTETGFTTAKAGYYVGNTSNMYVNREPRFYADITFSGSEVPVVPTSGHTYVGFFYTGNSGKQGAARDWPKTGYTARRNIHPNTNFGTSAFVNRPAMMIRLAEIYLNYAEALNEYAPGNPDVLVYLNLVRQRAGVPDLPTGLSQAEMRTQIQTERRLEFAFEGHRYFDVRRWKIAHTPENHQGGAFYGMNMDQGTALNSTGFYQRTVAVTRAAWKKKNYFWPVPQSEVDRNKQLAQFPGY
jgi:hypothetical protein